jgi:hypothetical protein
MTEPRAVNKPSRRPARSLAELLAPSLRDSFAKQGFAATELVTRWPEIVGAEVAAHAEPMRVQWPRGDREDAEPATLVLRVEGPAALEIQHLSGVIIERVNQFFGWPAIGRIALRQAPLTRRPPKTQAAPPPAEEVERIAAQLTGVDSDDLRAALARLGAAIKRT